MKARRRPVTDEILRLEHVKKSFGDHEVLRDISLSANRGDVICIIGPSGSGKSTFLRCLNLLEKPTGGEIWFEGRNIAAKGCDIDVVRQRMGMVF